MGRVAREIILRHYLQGGLRSVFVNGMCSFVAALAAGVGACSLPRAQVQNDVTSSPRPLLLSPCRPDNVQEDLRCGTIKVPENRRDPGGRELSLRVIVIPARSPDPDPVPIFVFAGGPGEAATSYAAGLVSSWERENNHVVLVDQRGTGEGNRLHCRYPRSEDAQTYLTDIFQDSSFWADCARRLSATADLSQYATPSAVQDVDDVRRTLGVDKIHVMGGSYGSRAAMIYARMFLRHVETAFLSGLVPLSIRSPLFHAASAQRAFDLMVSDCRADADCQRAYPDPARDLQIVLARLSARPAQVQTVHPATGSAATVTLTRSAFVEGLRAMLYSAENARRIPLLLRKALRGDFKEVTDRQLRWGYAIRDDYSVAMGLSANCTEDTARITPEDVERETGGSFVGTVLVRSKMTVCSLWPRAELPANHFAPFRIDVPTLLVSAQYDPVTPPRWGAEAQRSFSNSVHVIIPTGHSIPESECFNNLGRQMLRTRSPKRIDASCVASMSLPPFPLPEK